MDGNGTAPLWEITSQQETYDRAPNGAFANGVQIAFRTRSGAMGSVFVPYSEYTEQRARAAVDARATAMENVHNLTGEG